MEGSLSIVLFLKLIVVFPFKENTTMRLVTSHLDAHNNMTF